MCVFCLHFCSSCVCVCTCTINKQKCSNFYRKLIEKKEIVDENYVLDDKGKAKFLHVRGKTSKGKAKSAWHYMGSNGALVKLLSRIRGKNESKKKGMWTDFYIYMCFLPCSLHIVL